MQYNLMLPINAVLWLMNQNRSCVKTGKTSGGIVWGGGAVFFPIVWLRVHSAPFFTIYCPLETSLGSTLYPAHHSSVSSVSSSWLLGIHSYPLSCPFQSSPSDPFSSRGAALRGPGVQSTLVAKLVLTLTSVSSSWVIASSSWLFKPGPLIREGSLVGHPFTGFAYG